ncbi:MAG: hypothetical protein BHW58_02395 [Azospirillum sp. 51_20]|nr:MAG: hypothetical protein BHW58_02395 [Azospirillum sp. 51_20]
MTAVFQMEKCVAAATVFPVIRIVFVTEPNILIQVPDVIMRKTAILALMTVRDIVFRVVFIISMPAVAAIIIRRPLWLMLTAVRESGMRNVRMHRLRDGKF